MFPSPFLTPSILPTLTDGLQRQGAAEVELVTVLLHLLADEGVALQLVRHGVAEGVGREGIQAWGRYEGL